MSDEDAPRRDEDDTDVLKPLIVQEKMLLQNYGPEHPKVLAARKQIEVTRKLLEQEMPDELFSLLLQRETLLESFGPKHPQVLAIQKQIDVTQRLHEAQTESRERREHGHRQRDEASVGEEEAHSDADSHDHEHTVGQRLEAIEHKLGSLGAQLNAVSSEIRRTRQLIESSSFTANHRDGEQRAAEDDRRRSSIAAQLLPLRVERELLLENHGPGHPKVKSIQKQIEVTERLLTEERQSPEKAARR